MRLLCRTDTCNDNVAVVNAAVQLSSAVTSNDDDDDKHEDDRNDKCTICLCIFEEDERVRSVLYHLCRCDFHYVFDMVTLLAALQLSMSFVNVGIFTETC